jgi:apolipoprotein N-acyltransferase
MPPLSFQDQVPLVVDLDGTLIATDLLWEHLACLVRRNPLSIFSILFWWTRGRAFLKKKLVERVKVDPSTLPYNAKFLAWLRGQKSAGRKIILATASDLRMAQPVADFVGIFDEVLGSDGKTNLRSENKLKVLVGKFGERGFDYAGNSSADFAVWRGAREAIVVNASPSLAEQASRLAKIGDSFLEGYSPFTLPACVLNELFIRSGYLLAIAAGILLAMAFPKFNIAGFAWVAPGLLVFASRDKSHGDAFRIGYLGGFVFWLITLYWLLLIPVAGLPILGWIVLSAFLALFSGTWLWMVNWKADGWACRIIWSLAGAMAWVALDMLRARIFGGFPWCFIGVSQFQMTPLIQIASVTGVYGVSFLVVWASLSLFSAGRMIFEKTRSRFAWQREIILPLFVVAGLFAWGEFRMLAPMEPAPALSITMVQPSIPQNLIWDQTVNSNRFQQLLAASNDALTNGASLLLWPESAVPDLDTTTYIAITNLVRARHVWLIFNADDVLAKTNATPNDLYDVYNAAFLFDPDGNFDSVYHKQKLVIFGEYIPLVKYLPFIKWFTPITGGFEAGNEPIQFEMPGLQARASPLICFEDSFPQLARRATTDDTDFLVNLTNDGWFGNSAEQWQHMASALFRAVENGVPLVRCCNNGVSCSIDANGRIRDLLRDENGTVYGAGAMTFELQIRPHTSTFYNRHGDWFGWGCVGVASLVLAGTVLRRKKV